jgi:hypothetical protein
MTWVALGGTIRQGTEAPVVVIEAPLDCVSSAESPPGEHGDREHHPREYEMKNGNDGHDRWMVFDPFRVVQHR